MKMGEQNRSHDNMNCSTCTCIGSPTVLLTIYTWYTVVLQCMVLPVGYTAPTVPAPIVHADGNGPRTPPPRHGSLSGAPSPLPAEESVRGMSGIPSRENVPPSASLTGAAVPDSSMGNESEPLTVMTPPVTPGTLPRRSSRHVLLGMGRPSPTVPAPASPPLNTLRGEEKQPPDREDGMPVVAASAEGVRAPPPRVAQNQFRSPDGRVIRVSPRPSVVGAATSGGILEVMPVSVASGMAPPPKGTCATAGGGDDSQLRRASQQRENIKTGNAQASPAPLPSGLTGELMRNVAALDVTRMSCDQVGMYVVVGVYNTYYL